MTTVRSNAYIFLIHRHKKQLKLTYNEKEVRCYAVIYFIKKLTTIQYVLGLECSYIYILYACISDMLTVYQPRRTLHSMGSVTLVVLRVRTSSYGKRKFQCSAAKLWNALPPHIRESKTLNIFKMLLKMHLLSSHFDL